MDTTEVAVQYRIQQEVKKMLSRLLDAHTVYLVYGYTDMRKSIDGLVDIVQQQFLLTPFVRGIFLFCDQRHDRKTGNSVLL